MDGIPNIDFPSKERARVSFFIVLSEDAHLGKRFLGNSSVHRI